MNKKDRYLPLLGGSYYFVFYTGITMAIRASLLPQVKNYFNINYTYSGLLFLLPLLPGLAGNIFTGYIFNIFNKKKILIAGSLLSLLFSLLVPLSTSYFAFLFLAFIISIGLTSCNAGANIAAADVLNKRYFKFKDNGINLLHFSFSFGAVISLIIVSLYSDKITNWQGPYLMMALAAIPFFVAFIFSKYPPVKQKHNKKDFSFRHYLDIFKNPKMTIYIIITMLYAGAECGMASWIPTLLEKGYGYTKGYSSFILLLFFLFLTIGRLLGSLFIHKFNKFKLIYTLIFLLLISIILGFVFHIQIFNLDLFIPLCGLFFSIIFPTFQNLMITDFKDDLNAATAVFYCGTIIGISFLPFLIGIMNDLVGIKYGILITAFYALLILPFLPILKIITGKPLRE